MGINGVFQTNSIQERLNSWQRAIIKRDTAQAKQMLVELENQSIHSMPTCQMRGYYHLLRYGHYVFIREFDEAKLCFNELEEYLSSFNTEEMFLFYLFRGMDYRINSERNQEALALYQKAEKLIPSIDQDALTAELYYQTAAVLFELIKSFDSFMYLQKAYTLFENMEDYARLSGCEMLIGLNCIDMHQYEEAERRFHLALKQANKTNDISLKNLAYHDLSLP
ncbi:hypothetical protein GCM10011391_25910 [Pullulanibacillus camelliae]|uniref:Tetratricopeptide repeat protein n=1 Tax=Pullulanibacillus camelliae TaxID=1707096 RepID=A0A8J3DUG1_9BACL|nr:hypothetical protein [Pullulanibacillus camelliae]GGE45873.1 hypothetical protein GCM10011391_25910 [Pullulanibacillus camelliae]